MLSRISCDLFRQREITFHSGLNVVLGDDQARNSIGKSLALLIIDYAMGGDSLLEDKAGAIKTLGHHEYRIEFVFREGRRHYIRSTEAALIVKVCDPSFKCTSELTIEEFRQELKTQYALDTVEISFRSFVSPFSRIWHKGAHDPDHPLSSAPKESAAAAIDRLVAAFERSQDVREESLALKTLKKRKKIIASSMRAGLIPKINKKRYKSNLVAIKENTDSMLKAASSLSDALGIYEALFDAEIRQAQDKRADLLKNRSRTLDVIHRLEKDIQEITQHLPSNIALLAEFFPNIDTDRLQKVDNFHKGLSRLVSKELKAETAAHRLELEALNERIADLENSIRAKLDSKSTPGDIFEKAFELKSITDRAEEENRLYELRSSVETEVKLATQNLDSLIKTIYRSIEDKINATLQCFTRFVYGASRTPSQIKITSGSSFELSSPADSGTGKSYAGLIGLDLAMLDHTRLPYLIHDSLIYKNIEVRATKRIVRLLSMVRNKQVFLALDEAAKFGSATRERLIRHTVLKLDEDSLLYTKDWRTEKPADVSASGARG